ncbi:MAG: staygreen family protein [Lysinibacillus sp.]
MSKFQPERLSVEYRDGVTATAPIFPRCYTLTHSDTTGQLFLTLGTQFAWDKLNSTRDEVLGTWAPNGTSFCAYVYIDQGEYPENAAARRNDIFRRELPLALTAIRYGDGALFAIYPQLDQAPIIIHFMSAHPQFARQENWGAFRNFSF